MSSESRVYENPSLHYTDELIRMQLYIDVCIETNQEVLGSVSGRDEVNDCVYT